MDPQDYPGSQYRRTGQRFSPQTSSPSPYSSTQTTNPSSPAYTHSYPQTSSGSEQGGYDYDPYDASGPDDAASQASRRSHGASSAPGSASTNARRREQNRLAQRALRQRRENHIRSLEDRILHTSLETRHLASENRELSQQLHSVASQNEAMRRQELESHTNAAAWTHYQQHATVAPAYGPYAPHSGGAQAMVYGGQAPSYHQSALSPAGAPTSAAAPNPNYPWPWDNASAQAQYDSRYWEAEHGYPGGYAQQHRQHSGEADEEDDDEEDEEEDYQHASHGWSCRR